MFCSGCGVQMQNDLNYCNRCGNKVPKSGSMSVAENLSQSVGYIGGFGLLGYIFVVLVIIKKDIPPSFLIPVSFFYLATLFGICYLIIRQSGQLAQTKPAENHEVTPASPPPAYLRPVITAQLDEARDPGIGSVTDHTTRTLENIPVKRNDQEPF